ncbi:MAG: glycosyltransferase family 2 protein [Candidatus Omnitrophica bacterium]|nr:glycosyltransferase family 2 protein [Candidatus Omnitrophota bacterium]
MQPICDIVIPIWNQPELTGRCLESILAATLEPVRLILIDNGSEPPTRELLDRFCASSRVQTTLIRNDVNLGFIKAVNQGIQAAQAPWICLLNNDTVVTQGWLTEMLKAADRIPNVGLINPTSNSLGFRPGKMPLEEYAQNLRRFSGQTTELTVALGFCLLAKKSVFDQVGLLDESFGMGYFEDDDLSRRVRRAGFTNVRACGSYVYHEEKGSFRHLKDSNRSFDENRRLFEKKWGRRLRILWTYYGPQLPGPFPEKTALRLLQEGHWITLMAPAGAVPSDLSSHAQLIWRQIDGSRWRLHATWRLLTKRKKPFHMAISYDPVWSAWVQRLKLLHRAALQKNPSEEEILRQCRELSHVS